MELTLVIANKNYSSWSLRAWLMLKQTGAPFRELQVPLGQPDTPALIRRHSPSALAPALLDGDLTVWDSLAIGEYLHEKFPAAQLWPQAPAERARARSLSAEMHAGFSALRQNLPFNARGHYPGRPVSAECRANIERVCAIWRECRERSGGPFLFGHSGIADAMYAPVALRFRTYGIALAQEAEDYVALLTRQDAIQDWLRAAREESARIEKYEPAPL